MGWVCDTTCMGVEHGLRRETLWSLGWHKLLSVQSGRRVWLGVDFVEKL